MKLAIIGASGHGKVVADIAEKNGYDDIEFYDDNQSLTHCGKWPVVGLVNEVPNEKNDSLFVAIGNNKIRKKIMDVYECEKIITLIHPKAVIAEDVTIEKGTVIMAGAVINSGTRIGKGCIINTCSSVDHDCILGDYVHVAPGGHMCGSVLIGDETWIGAGAAIINNISICNNCMIGAGGVVTKDITLSGTYVGVPMRMIK